MKSELKKRVLQGGASLAFARLSSRAFDLVRMLTIARWLGPDEMGVYAVASLALFGLEQFTETGLRPALIQRAGDITSYILPVRTVQVMRGLVLGLIVFISAPFLAKFFASPKSLEILRIIAFIPVIKGFEPLSITLAQKRLHFTPVVIIQIASSFGGLLVGLTVASIRPDAWALVWATLTTAVLTTLGASIISERKYLNFSLNWQALKDLNKFGFWIFVNSLVSYLFIKGGDWVVGRVLDVKSLAYYQMAFLVCTVATTELGMIVAQIALPVFSQIQSDILRLRSAFSQSFGIVSLITFSMAGLVCSCSSDFFGLVLGEKWAPALPMVPWLTVWGVCAMFSSCMVGLFQALNMPKVWAQTVMIMTLMLAVGIFPMVRVFGPVGVGILMASIGVVMQIARYFIISRILGLRFVKVLAHVWVPALACIIAACLTIEARSTFKIGYVGGCITSGMIFLIIYLVMLGILRSWMEPSPEELLRRITTLFGKKFIPIKKSEAVT